MTKWPLKPKVWQWVFAWLNAKMEVSRLSGTAPPSTHHLFIEMSVQRCAANRGLGGGALLQLDALLVPPSLPTYELSNAQVCPRFYSGHLQFPNKSTQHSQRTSEKNVRDTCTNNAGRCVLPASLLPWPGPPRVAASSCSKRQRETWSSCEELGHKCRRNTFLTDISRLFHNCQTTGHMQSLAEAKSASLDCACVCTQTQIARFEGNADSQQNSL